MVIDIHTHIYARDILPEGFLEWAQQHPSFAEMASYSCFEEPRETVLRRWQLSGKHSLDQAVTAFLEGKRRAGITTSVLLCMDFPPSFAPVPMSYIEMNRYFGEVGRKHPGEILVFAGIDPHRGEEGVKVLEVCVREWEHKGLKLHPHIGGYFPNDKSIYPYYAKAQELNVPVLFHTGPSPSSSRMEFAHPRYIDQVAADFPALNIILGHFQDPWVDESIAMATWRPNVYLEVSFGQLMYRTDPERFCRKLKLLLRTPARKRVIFGTDAPGSINFFLSDKDWVDALRGLNESEFASDLQVSPAAIEDLLGGNAQRLLGLC